MSEPDYGSAKPANTSRMTQDKGNTDAPRQASSTENSAQTSRRNIRDSLSELQRMGVNSESFKERAQKAKEETQKQTNYKKPPRRATGREAMIAERYMNQEQKKKNNESSVVG